MKALSENFITVDTYNFKEGLSMNIKELWGRGKPYLFSSDTILLLKRPAGTAVPEVNDCPAEFRQITLDNVEDCLAFEDAKYVEIYKQKIAAGDYGLYGYLDGRPVFRSWVKCGGSFYFKRAWKMEITEKCAYSEYAYTSPKARNKHIHRKANTIVVKQHFNKDIFTLVKPDNIASIKNYINCGFKPYIQITVKYFCFIPFVKEEKL
jgi:hypothetical protein